jgi:hypothetical protein
MWLNIYQGNPHTIKIIDANQIYQNQNSNTQYTYPHTIKIIDANQIYQNQNSNTQYTLNNRCSCWFLMLKETIDPWHWKKTWWRLNCTCDDQIVNPMCLKSYCPNTNLQCLDELRVWWSTQCNSQFLISTYEL